MLAALDVDGRHVLGWEAERRQHYFCPECHEELIYKAGRVVVEHFAHRSDALCAFGEGEGFRHMEMKKQVGKVFEDLGEVSYETVLGCGRRADVIIQDAQGKTVIECQDSAISIAELEARTKDYNRAGYRVLWLWDIGRIGPQNKGGRFVDLDVDEEQRIPVEVLHCHKVSWGRVYGLDGLGELRAIHFWPVSRHSDWTGADYKLRRTRTYSLYKPPLWLMDSRSTDMSLLLASLGEMAWWNGQVKRQGK